MICLDNAATTKVDANTNQIMTKYNTELFFNNSALYGFASDINADINKVRKHILNFVGASQKSKLVFTSGATESNNLAILGTRIEKDKCYIFSIGEHSSVNNTAKELIARGKNVKFVPLSQSGEIDYEAFENLLSEDVGFVSIMFVSNETGAINDLKRISDIINKKSPKAIFHVDAVQGFCKLDLNLLDNKIDLCTISGHKIYAPKGIGALVINEKVSLNSIVWGGNQEYGIRSGTENVAAIMAFDSVIKKYDLEFIKSLKNKFIKNLKEIENLILINGSGSPYVLSISIKGLRGETIVHMLEKYEIIISTGSACSSSKIGNRVLFNMGRTKEEILGSIRISFSKNNTEDEIEIAAKTLVTVIKNLFEIYKRK